MMMIVDVFANEKGTGDLFGVQHRELETEVKIFHPNWGLKKESSTIGN